MELLHRPETQPERQMPAQLQAARQQTLDDRQSLCDRPHLAMHRRHRYASAIGTGYGEIHLPVPAFPGGPGRRMTGGITPANLDAGRRRAVPPDDRRYNAVRRSSAPPTVCPKTATSPSARRP